MPELESSKYFFFFFPILKQYRKEGRPFQRGRKKLLFDMYILAWLHELRNQHNLAMCWPKMANNKIGGKRNF